MTVDNGRQNYEEQTRSCNTDRCRAEPRDGSWGTWTSFDDCSVSCDGGVQRRSRRCDSPSPSNGGLSCKALDGVRRSYEEESRLCNLNRCAPARHGNWGEWTTYGECSRQCDGGVQTRSRSCNNPSPRNGGNSCRGMNGQRSDTEEQSRTCNTQVCEPATETDCDANVGFVLDASGTLTSDFTNAKRFLNSLAEGFGVSRTGSRASVITFSYKAVHAIKFDDHYDIESFKSAVDRLPLLNSTTRIDIALRLAQQEMFERRNGYRDDMNKILVLFTDGEQTKRRGSEDPAMVAEELRRNGINLIVVGVGGAVNPSKILRIAGGHSNKVFYASTYEGLMKKNTVGEILKENCIYVAPPVACNGPLDIAFILDASGSVRGYFDTEKRFLKTLANAYGISRDGSRSGVITFSYYVEHSIKLNDHYNQTSFNDAVDAIKLMGSTTDIAQSLRVAQRDFFTQSNGNRANVRDLVVLITDGDQTHGNENPRVVADELRNQGVKVVAVGIGDAANKTTLNAVTGDEKYVFTVPGFNSLADKSFLQSILRVTCNGDFSPSVVRTTLTPPEPVPTEATVCADDWSLCAIHGDKCFDYTDDWTDYMQRSCRKSCGYC